MGPRPGPQRLRGPQRPPGLLCPRGLLRPRRLSPFRLRLSARRPPSPSLRPPQRPSRPIRGLPRHPLCRRHLRPPQSARALLWHVRMWVPNPRIDGWSPPAAARPRICGLSPPSPGHRGRLLRRRPPPSGQWAPMPSPYHLHRARSAASRYHLRRLPVRLRDAAPRALRRAARAQARSDDRAPPAEAPGRDPRVPEGRAPRRPVRLRRPAGVLAVPAWDASPSVVARRAVAVVWSKNCGRLTPPPTPRRMPRSPPEKCW